MSSPLPTFIPLLIVAMVTWKISYSKKTSKFTGASPSLRSAGSRASNRNVPWESSISERLSARNVKQSRPTGNNRSSLSNAKRILNKERPSTAVKQEEQEKRDRRL